MSVAKDPRAVRLTCRARPPCCCWRSDHAFSRTYGEDAAADGIVNEGRLVESSRRLSDGRAFRGGESGGSATGWRGEDQRRLRMERVGRFSPPSSETSPSRASARLTDRACIRFRLQADSLYRGKSRRRASWRSRGGAPLTRASGVMLGAHRWRGAARRPRAQCPHRSASGPAEESLLSDWWHALSRIFSVVSQPPAVPRLARLHRMMSRNSEEEKRVGERGRWKRSETAGGHDRGAPLGVWRQTIIASKHGFHHMRRGECGAARDAEDFQSGSSPRPPEMAGCGRGYDDRFLLLARPFSRRRDGRQSTAAGASRIGS